MSLFLRLADETDEFRLLNWRNDDRVRKFFFQPEVVTPKEHEKWFRETVLSRRALCFVGYENNFPEVSEVGYCRFDRKAEGFFEVSIVISPEKQGRGLAGPLLAEACIRLRQVQDTPVTIEAKIKKGNFRSLRLFESAGFRGLHKDDGEIWVLEKHLS